MKYIKYTPVIYYQVRLGTFMFERIEKIEKQRLRNLYKSKHYNASKDCFMFVKEDRRIKP